VFYLWYYNDRSSLGKTTMPWLPKALLVWQQLFAFIIYSSFQEMFLEDIILMGSVWSCINNSFNPCWYIAAVVGLGKAVVVGSCISISLFFILFILVSALHI